VTEDELRRSLAILVGDRQNRLAGADDPVADLWAQRFEHVAYLAIDSFAVGNADDLEAFEAEAARVARDTSELSMVAQGQDDRMIDSLEARALQSNLLGGLSAAAGVAASVAVDVPTRAALGAQVILPEERWVERFVDALAAGLGSGQTSGAPTRVTAALGAWGADLVASGKVGAAFDFLAAVGTALPAYTTAARASGIDADLGGAFFDPARLDETLRGLTTGTADTGTTAGVVRLLSLSKDDAYFDVVLARYRRGLDPTLQEGLKRYISRWVDGHAGPLTRTIETGTADVAIELLDLLGKLASPVAAAAVVAGLRNPHSEVKLDALAKLKPDQGHAELQALLGDSAQRVRCQALRVIGELRIRGLGPAVVRRLQHESFAGLDLDERRAWLACLHVLNPVRAEEIAVAMLSHAPLIRDEANDRSRLLAAEILVHAESAEALAATRKASRSAWWNSPEVRSVAEKAAAAILTKREGKGGVT
jgi:hypothetical protein